MRTVRRLYFYAISLISLEVVLWGLIGLVRSIINPNIVGGSITQLAQALSLILVGVPVFLIHWYTAQRNARDEMEEHSSSVRAFFLYAILLAVLIPIVQNGMQLVNQLILVILRMSTQLTLFNKAQFWTDNFIAILMNGLIAIYFIGVVRKDWMTVKTDDSLSKQRRLYRYVWVIYALVIVVAGVQQLIQYILTPTQSTFGVSSQVILSNSLTLLISGLPLFYYSWLTVQKSLVEARERESLLRLGILYILALAGVITVLSSGGIVLRTILLKILGDPMNMEKILNTIKSPLSLGISLGGVWAYFGHWLSRSMKEVPDAPRRSGLRRFYAYILSAIGLVALFIGMSMLLSFIIDGLAGRFVWNTALRPRLASALAVLCVSFPLWWFSWRPMQIEALQDDDCGDHARRSLMRRIYLFAALFASVIGGMIVTGSSLYLILRQLLGDNPNNFLVNLFNNLQLLFLFTLVGLYHGQTLRKDGKKAADTLEKMHSKYPVLLLDQGNYELIATIMESFDKQLPELNLEVVSAEKSIKDFPNEKFKAVLIPGEQVLNPSKEISDWLNGFSGTRIALTNQVDDYEWIGPDELTNEQIAKKAVKLIQQLAEGQEIRRKAGPSGWLIAFYILLGLILTPILTSLIAEILF